MAAGIDSSTMTQDKQMERKQNDRQRTGQKERRRGVEEADGDPSGNTNMEVINMKCNGVSKEWKLGLST